MKPQARKNILAMSVAILLVSACSPNKQMTKPEQSNDLADNLVNTNSPVVKNADAATLHDFPASPMKVAMDNKDCSKHQINNNGTPEDAVKIRVTGYGAPPKSFYPDPQRRLMAMRAAKIDAYRSLAERVTGIQIWGGTTIGDMVVEKDRFRVYIDTYINGARVIAENPLDDGTFETIVELTVDQNFLNKTLPEKATNDCVQNVDAPIPPETAVLRTAGVGDIAGSKFYFSE